jgi:ABC-type proline/glycine betaine transport system permease subunit
MEYYTTTAQMETHTIMLIIGLAIMLIGGYFVSLLVKDENKMAKWLVGVVTVGGILTSGSVLAMALGF